MHEAEHFVFGMLANDREQRIANIALRGHRSESDQPGRGDSQLVRDFLGACVAQLPCTLLRRQLQRRKECIERTGPT